MHWHLLAAGSMTCTKQKQGTTWTIQSTFQTVPSPRIRINAHEPREGKGAAVLHMLCCACTTFGSGRNNATCVRNRRDKHQDLRMHGGGVGRHLMGP